MSGADLKVGFRCDPALIDVSPRPQRASAALPEGLRKMPATAPSAFHGEPGRTVKQCPPFVEAMRRGSWSRRHTTSRCRGAGFHGTGTCLRSRRRNIRVRRSRSMFPRNFRGRRFTTPKARPSSSTAFGRLNSIPAGIIRHPSDQPRRSPVPHALRAGSCRSVLSGGDKLPRALDAARFRGRVAKGRADRPMFSRSGGGTRLRLRGVRR